MKKEELIRARDLVKQQFDNLSNSNWVALELNHLRGKFDILNEVIESIEKEEAANATNSTEKQADSHNDQGSQAV